MPNVNWTWFIIGILTAMFILPFVQAKLGAALGGGRPHSANN